MKEGIYLYKVIDCIDAGSDYCPCSLAEINECILCSQLNGKVFCDCINWKGTCIYQEFIWNNHKKQKTRQFQTFKIIGKKPIRDDLFLLEIKVNRTMARDLNNIGAFVFLKKPDDENIFSTPISIMTADLLKNTVTAAIRINGIKTKSLNECTDEIMVKGPYWNGIQGQKFIKGLKNDNCIIAARGVEAAPCVLAAKKMIKNMNHITVLLDVGRSTENFTKKYFINLGCEVKDISLCSRSGFINDNFKALIEDQIRKNNIKTVLLGGNDTFYSETIGFIQNSFNNINFAIVNNSTMCCGEGVCGSCLQNLNKNEKIKSCKQQFNPAELYKTCKASISTYCKEMYEE
jgi:NAD(P)H-flavin reductase